MKTIGLIGGVSWVSTLEYYRRINTQVNRTMGGVASAKIILDSFNFEDILPYQLSGDEKKEGEILVDCATTLQGAGADVILVCSCTTSMLVDSIRRCIHIPVLNIVESISHHVRERGFARVGLLGTRRTMYGGFFQAVLEKNGLEVVVPRKRDGEVINRIIYQELVNNVFSETSSRRLDECIDHLAARDVEAVILGCTELPLLCKRSSNGVALVDSIQVHVDEVLHHVFPEEKVACCG
jgi:aspartate racemase